MGLEKTMNLRRKRFQRKDHIRDLVRVWIKFMFTAGKTASSELALLRKHSLLTVSGGCDVPEVLVRAVLPADRFMIFQLFKKNRAAVRGGAIM